MSAVDYLSAFEAYTRQLKTLCLREFPCGLGNWRDIDRKQIKLSKKFFKDPVQNRFLITLKDFGTQFEKTETLQEYVTSEFSPWHIDYSWSDEAEKLREVAVKCPWLIDDKFILDYFHTLRIIDKGVTEIDREMLKFRNLEQLTMSANFIKTVNSKNLPTSLKVLELCANEIDDISGLCSNPPRLLHLGLGYNEVNDVGEYITGNYWPDLMSIDLSHNNLCNLTDVVHKLRTLPHLRNAVLIGNPFALIPGYRGYTIDSLQRLKILDDLRITVDERDNYKGLAKIQEGNPAEAEITLRVSYLKGIPMPSEQQDPDDYPEFPIPERTYFVQFLFPAESTSQQFTEVNLKEEVAVVPGKEYKDISPQEETGTKSNFPTFQLAPVQSTVSPWMEDIQLDWSASLVRNNLLGLRDFFKEGMQFSVMESLVLCYPLEDEDVSPPHSAGKKGKDKGDKTPLGKKGDDKNKKNDKKNEKEINKKGGQDSKKDDKKKKKKGESESEMKRLPPELRTLATFSIPLADFLDGDFLFQSVFQAQNVELIPMVREADLPDSGKKKKDKKKDGGNKKDAKKGNKDEKSKDKRQQSPKRGDSTAEGRKGSAKPDKKGDAKGKKGGIKIDEESDISLPPPTLEVSVSVQLCSWKTTQDCIDYGSKEKY